MEFLDLPKKTFIVVNPQGDNMILAILTGCYDAIYTFRDLLSYREGDVITLVRNAPGIVRGELWGTLVPYEVVKILPDTLGFVSGPIASNNAIFACTRVLVAKAVESSSHT